MKISAMVSHLLCPAFWGIAALGLLFSAGCSRGGEARTGAATIPVQAVKAVQRNLAITQTAIGAVQSQRMVAVRSQVDGIISQIHFREGDEVKAGDLLVTIDPRPFANNLSSARADLVTARAQSEHARTEAERYQQLDQQQAVSKEQLAQLLTDAESTGAQVQAKEAAVANAELQLGYTQIRAPISGRTGQLLLHEGALVKANDAGFTLLTINQLAPITVAFSVPESLLASLRDAMAAGPVTVTARPHDGVGKPVDGRLEFIDNAVDSTTGTVLLKATFSNDNRALWPGQFADVSMHVGDETDVVLVPDSAVGAGQSGDQVFVIKADQTVDLRPVKIGRSEGGVTVIRSGVKAGESVVTDGQIRLISGAKVEIKPLISGDSNLAEAPAAPAKAGS